MKKEIRVVNAEKGIIQITTLDERWYAVKGEDTKTGLPTYIYKPSSTWIAEHYPKGVGFYKWLASKGWDEAEAIKTAAGEKGSKVHQASQELEKGTPISINQGFVNPATGLLEPLSTEEIDAIFSFTAWHKETKPQLLASEMTVVGEDYAGTLDRIYRIGKEVVIVDLKTSAEIYPSHELQVSSYSHADIDYKVLGITDEEWAARKLAILQLGYRKNTKHFKFTPIEDKYNLFRHAYDIWRNENPDSKPKQRDYPLVLTLEG